jgi:hypothetical protein
MMPTLHLRLLGDFSLIYGDRQVTSLNTTRLQSLLAYDEEDDSGRTVGVRATPGWRNCTRPYYLSP